MILHGSGQDQYKSPAQTNSELNKNLRQLNSNICCLKDSMNGPKDYELFIACDSVSGDPVIVTYGFDTNGTFTITYTDINGQPFVGTLTSCSNSYSITNFQWFCLNGNTQISRVDLYQNGVFQNFIWQNMAGTVITAPTAGTYVIGLCVSSISQANTTQFNVLENDNNKNHYTAYQENSSYTKSPVYQQTVRIVSDVDDIIRTEHVNNSTEVIPCCYNTVADPIIRDGFLILEKTHNGYIKQQWICPANGSISQSQAVTNPILQKCPDVLKGVTYNRTPIGCIKGYDIISGDPKLIFNCTLVEERFYENNSLTTQTMYFADALNPTDDITNYVNLPVAIRCPERTCVTNGSSTQYGFAYEGDCFDLSGTFLGISWTENVSC